MNHRLQGWKASLFSQACRATLIQSVLHSNPVYTMSVFQLPKKDIRKMESTMIDFFWGFKHEGKRMNLLCKDRLLSSKVDGVLDFRHLSLVNEALLSKHGWQWVHETSSLTSAWVLNKYKVPNMEFQFCNIT